jgi:hypothetical protein
MKILFFISFFTLISTQFFGQNLNDYINFDSLNKELINNSITNRIISERNFKNATEIVVDSTPICSANYHVAYFETYGDMSSIHTKLLYYDVYHRGYKIYSMYETPHDRLNSLSYPFYKRNEHYLLIDEISKFYNLGISPKIKYNELIENVLIDFISEKSNTPLILDFTNIKKYIGITCGIFKNEYGEIIFGSTIVVSKKIYNNKEREH